MDAEVWRPVVGYEGWYEVSDLGRVRRVRYIDANPTRRRKDPRVLKLHFSKRHGYAQLCLSKDGLVAMKKPHKLVAEAFHGPCPQGLVTAHLDGDRRNNTPDNLAYVTQQENYWQSEAHGTRCVGERHGKVKARLARSGAIQ